jgi:hypothetical protein
MTDPVFEGPRWYRGRIHRLGPLLALTLPAALWLVDTAVRLLLEGRARGWISLLARTWAAPGLLAVGYPFATSSERPLGVFLSVPIWLLVGVGASRVATRNPVALFGDYWRAYLWLAAAVFAGTVVALGSATVFLGRSLIV